MNLFLELVAQRGLTLLMATHSVENAAALGRRVEIASGALRE
jgi:ABC-type nitrate/sulfonate/bicarbonate transport system ATPase subunit